MIDYIKKEQNYSIRGYIFITDDYHTVDSWKDFSVELVTEVAKEYPTAIGKLAESKTIHE